MGHDRILTLHNKAYSELDQNNLESALEIIEEIKKLGNGWYIDYVVSGLLIDIGTYKNDFVLVQEGISLLENRLKEIPKSHLKNSYYNLANGYSSIFKFKIIDESYYHFFEESTEMDTAIKYYRDALSLFPPTPEENVNLGNMLNSSGRSLDALDCYEKALKLNKNHSMALLNKGIALVHYARFSKHWPTFFKEAHDLLNKAKKIGLPIEAMDSFEMYSKLIKRNFKDEKFLETPRKLKTYDIKTNNSFEKYLIEFCLENQLYLNICNFCQNCENSIGDNIFIKGMITSIKKEETGNYFGNDPYLRLSSYLNQIKQDYITSRYLLILSRYGGLDLSFLDKNVTIIDTLQYKQYNIYLQLLIFAFKNMYDILDKISFFINDYLELGIKEYFVDFKSIWFEKGNKKKQIRNKKILEVKNPSLNALFKINQDLKDSNKILNKLRNNITHKFIQIEMFPDKENSETLTEEELVNHALELTRIVRNAIIYLVTFVDIEEEKNRKKSDKLKRVTLEANEIPHNLKSDRH